VRQHDAAADPGGYPDFEAFVRIAEPRLSRALAAAYGFEDSQDATAEALAYAFEHWDRLQHIKNLPGYLFRVGQTRARRRRQPVCSPCPTRPTTHSSRAASARLWESPMNDLKEQIHLLMERGVKPLSAADIARGPSGSRSKVPAAWPWRSPRIVAIGTGTVAVAGAAALIATQPGGGPAPVAAGSRPAGPPRSRRRMFGTSPAHRGWRSRTRARR